MITKIPSEHFKQSVLDGLTEKSIDLFYEEDGKTYMRYDGISITGTNEAIYIRLLFRGNEVYTLNVDCDFTKNNSIDLHGLKGSVEIDLI